MGQKKSNKKNKKSVADLILKHHFDDKIKDIDDEISVEEQENQELNENIGFDSIEEAADVVGDKIIEDEISDD